MIPETVVVMLLGALQAHERRAALACKTGYLMRALLDDLHAIRDGIAERAVPDEDVAP